MALANIAVLLSRHGLEVLVVDWDLEAPGLERYFGVFEMSAGVPGLLRMFIEARDCGSANFRGFASSFQCEGLHPVTLLGSGRDQDENYGRKPGTLRLGRFFQRTFFVALIGLVEAYGNIIRIIPWLIGSFVNADWGKVEMIAIPTLVGGAILVGLRWRLNLLSLGELDARSLGRTLAHCVGLSSFWSL